jgi:hypothetical protein
MTDALSFLLITGRSLLCYLLRACHGLCTHCAHIDNASSGQSPKSTTAASLWNGGLPVFRLRITLDADWGQRRAVSQLVLGQRLGASAEAMALQLPGLSSSPNPVCISNSTPRDSDIRLSSAYV